ncbi:MAG TPA: hypothetical protein VH251_11410 [Verrucomicrobiae bacterium]|jgi:hypothetical protein|nr:hypothetical protein [Verrucomicrobiae bacterium]
MPGEFQSLADELYRERVLRARRTPPEERILDGPRLFDYACSVTLAGLRSELPGASEDELRQALRRRLEIGRKLELAH